MDDREPQPCPKCGGPPALQRPGSFWKLLCAKHALSVPSGHTMKTKAEAIRTWNEMVRAAAALDGE